MRNALRILICSCLMVLFAVPAFAAAKTFAVLPFAIEAPSSLSYLGQAVVPMLNSRLFLKGQTESVSDSAIAGIKAASSTAEATKALKASGANYLVWGAIKVTGDNAIIDMRVSGLKNWQKTAKSTLPNLISTLQSMADMVNAEVFGRASAAAPRGSQQVQTMAPRSGNFVVNESVTREVYLNPQFRYQGADGDRLRSQGMPFAAVGMVVADVNGDKKNEIVLLEEHKVHIYSWDKDRMILLGSRDLPMAFSALTLRAIDLDKNGSKEIVVTMYDKDGSTPYGFIYSCLGNTITPIVERVPYFLNVTQLPPLFEDVLVAQRGDATKIFSNSGVFEMLLNGNSLMQGVKVALPDDGNVLNFTWLREGTKKDGNKLIVLTPEERLAVYSDKLSRMSLTDEKYSGTGMGIENQMNMPGLGKDDKLQPTQYYIPMRMLAEDLEKRGDYTLLVNKPISVAAQFFDRYRFFPEGEIHDLFWDGVGMSLLWKTRRIKGSVVDFGVADIANNGTNSLVVCINTHPGALGIANRKTVIFAYPLDVNQADPLTAPLIER